MRILIMGLPGSGKTTLAEALKKQLAVAGKSLVHFNADEVRKKYNDWDFSDPGRIRQSIRMRELADQCSTVDYAICDFVCPLLIMREHFDADITIWMDTIAQGRYADTNAAFESPKTYNYRVTEQDAQRWATIISTDILK